MTNNTNPVSDDQIPSEGSATQATDMQLAEDGAASIQAAVAAQAQQLCVLSHFGSGCISANRGSYSAGAVGVDPSLAAAVSEPAATHRKVAAHIYR